MATKKKPVRPTPATSGVNICEGVGYRMSPSEQIKQLQRQLESSHQRSPVEQSAAYVADLAECITRNRHAIQSLQDELSRMKDQLTTNLLNHQIGLAKLKDLTAVSQPI